MLAFAEELRGRGAGLRVLNLGGGDVDTATPMGSMLFTIMAELGQMEYEIKRDPARQATGQDRLLPCHQGTFNGPLSEG